MGNAKRRQKPRVARPDTSVVSPRLDAPRRALRAIIIAYLFIAVAYATAIPLGKGPDETAHVRYLEFLAKEHRLPVFDPANPDPNYEFHQPPLYYLLSLPCFLLAHQGETGQQVVRFFTLLVSLALLYLTFALARKLAPDDPWIPPAAAGVVAFLPMQLSIATTIGNDALTEVVAAATLLLLVSYLTRAREHKGNLRAMLAVGVFIGLGLLTKSIAFLLFPLAWLAAAFAARTADGFRLRQFLLHAAVATGVALALCGWWLLRNQMLYGDPMAQKAFLDAFQGLRPSPQDFMQRFHVTSNWTYVLLVVSWTLASATGVFGPVIGNRFVFFPNFIYFSTGLFAVCGAVGFVRYFLRTKLESWQRQSWWLCGIFALLLLASFVRFNFSFFQAQARYLFPVLPAAATAFALGLQSLFPQSWRPYILMGMVGLLALLAFGGLHLWIAPPFR